MRRHSALPFAALLLAAACAPRSADTAAATVDTAAVRTDLEAYRGRYIAARTANDVVGLSEMFAEAAGADLYGVPRLRGRPAILAAFQADSAVRKYTLQEITPLGMEARTGTDASELGTYHEMTDSSGTRLHAWGRYLVAFHKDADSQWRIVYLMAFPDSTKADK